jgi:hypothetical protein
MAKVPHVKLTAKQEAFAQAIADGMDQASAYRHAYEAEAMKETSVYVNASKLIKNANVAQRVSELKSQMAEKQLWTREMSVKALVQTFRDGPASVKVQCVKELNAMHGYNEPTKVSVNVKTFPTQIDDLF